MLTNRITRTLSATNNRLNLGTRLNAPAATVNMGQIQTLRSCFSHFGRYMRAEITESSESESIPILREHSVISGSPDTQGGPIRGNPPISGIRLQPWHHGRLGKHPAIQQVKAYWKQVGDYLVQVVLHVSCCTRKPVRLAIPIRSAIAAGG